MAEEKGLQALEAENAVENEPVDEYSLEELGFTGSYLHGLDAKGRMIIPAPFRKGLGNKFVVCPSEDCKNIALYPTKNWVERRNNYVQLMKRMTSIRPIFDFFTKFSYVQCEMDQQGRLLLPVALRAHYLKDSKEVDVSGAYDCIVICDSEKGRTDAVNFHETHPNVLAIMDEAQKLL